MLKRVGATAAVAAAVAIVVAATLGGTAAARATHHAAKAALCKTAGLGYGGPLSGPASFLGDDQLNWEKLFVADWNAGKAIPGVPMHLKRVKLTIPSDGLADGQLQSGPSATAARAVVADKKILGFVGFAGSNENLGGGPVFDHKKLAYVSGSATADNLTSTLKYFFRVVPNNSQQADAGVTYVVGKLKLKKGDKVLIVDDGEAYGIGIADAAQKLFKAEHITVDREQVAESTSTSTADFHTVAQKAVTLGVKLVYAPTQTATDSQTFVQLLHADGYKGGFMATDGSVSPSQFTYAGAFISFFGPSITKIDKSFRNQYKKKYGKTSANDPFGAPSFVAAEMLGVAISKACAATHNKSVSRASVAKKLKKVKLSTTILGYSMAFNNKKDHNHGPNAGVTVFQIQKNGSYKQVYAAG
jgi:ABC-type branched-subunit amino acid transport system substrate-binding protein